MANILTIIVGTRNRADHVLALYEDLKKQTFQDFNVLVMDDVSEVEEVNKLKSIKDERFSFFSNPPPHRLAGDLTFIEHLKRAINKGPKYIYNMHDDMKINSSDLLEKLVNCLEENEKYGAVAPTIYDGKGVMSWGPGIVKVRMGKEFNMNESYMVRTKCFKEMGLVCEEFIYYGSEYYIFNWLRNNGYQTKILGAVNITHYGGGTSSAYQDEKDYYRPRTTILIMKLFCKDDLFKHKLIYFYQEMSEPMLKMKKYLKNFQIFKLLRTLLIMFAGIVSGLLTKIEINEPYEP